MAVKKISLEGPIVKGYTELDPLVQGTDVSNVLLKNGFNMVNGELTYSWIDSEGNRQNSSIPLNRLVTSIKYGWTAGNAVATLAEGPVLVMARTAYDADMNPVKQVDGFRNGARIKIDIPAGSDWVWPWIAFPKTEVAGNLELDIYDDGEYDTDMWVKDTDTYSDVELWVSEVPYKRSDDLTEKRYYLRTYLTP